MYDRTTSRNSIAPSNRQQIRNPNIEIRNKLRDKQISNPENPKHGIRKAVCSEFYNFSHLTLFRISDLVLRNFCSWRPCAPSTSLRTWFARDTVCPISYSEFQIGLTRLRLLQRK